MIKRYFFAFTFVLCLSATAQDLKNKIMLNSSFNYSLLNNHYNGKSGPGSTRSSGAINILTGYYLSNKFALGVTGTFTKDIYKNKNTASGTNGSDTRNTHTSYAAGIFSRYHVPLKSERFGFFFQLIGTYNWGYSRSTMHDSTGIIGYRSTSRNYGVNMHLAPGIIYFLTDRCSMELSLGNVFYSYTTTVNELQNNVKNNISDFGIDFSMPTVFIGFSYYFGDKKVEPENP